MSLASRLCGGLVRIHLKQVTSLTNLLTQSEGAVSGSFGATESSRRTADSSKREFIGDKQPLVKTGKIALNWIHSNTDLDLGFIVPTLYKDYSLLLTNYSRGLTNRALMTTKLLSVADAADLLGVHRTRINQLIEAGDLPATRIGRAYVIEESDLDLVRERPSRGRPSKNAGHQAAASSSIEEIPTKLAK